MRTTIFFIFPESQLPFRFFLIREVDEEWRDFIITTKRRLLLIIILQLIINKKKEESEER